MRKILLNITIILLIGFISFCIIKISGRKPYSIPEEVITRLKNYLSSNKLLDSPNSIIIYFPSTSCSSCVESTMEVIEYFKHETTDNFSKIVLLFDKESKEYKDSITCQVYIIDPVDFERNGLNYSLPYIVVLKNEKFIYSSIISKSSVYYIHKKLKILLNSSFLVDKLLIMNKVYK